MQIHVKEKRMKTTRETDNYLAKLKPGEFSRYITGDYTSEYSGITDYLNKYVGAHGLVLSDVIKDSLISSDYAYQLFNGHKTRPSRERLIPVCLAMHMDLDETNRALKLCKAGTLYSKDPRDAVIIVCINNKTFNVMDVNEMLSENGFEPLQGTVSI